MSVGPGHYAVLSAIVFALGIYGVLARRNALAIILATGLLFAAPVIALAGFSRIGSPPVGDALAAFAIVAMCAETALGFALVLMLWRRRASADVDTLVDVEG